MLKLVAGSLLPAALAAFGARPGYFNTGQVQEAKRAGVHLPAPSQLAPADETVSGHYPRRTRPEWSPVEGAVSYTVEVDYCGCRPGGAKGCTDARPHAFALDSCTCCCGRRPTTPRAGSRRRRSKEVVSSR